MALPGTVAANTTVCSELRHLTRGALSCPRSFETHTKTNCHRRRRLYRSAVSMAGPAAHALALVLALACAQAALAGCPMAGLWQQKDADRRAPAQAAGGARRLATVGAPPPPPLPLPVRIAMDSAAAAAAGCNLTRLIAKGPELPPKPKQGAIDARVKWWAWQVMTSPVVGMGTPTRPNWRVPIAAFARLAFHDAGTYERCAGRGWVAAPARVSSSHRSLSGAAMRGSCAARSWPSSPPPPVQAWRALSSPPACRGSLRPPFNKALVRCLLGA